MKKYIVVLLHLSYWFMYLLVISGLLLVLDHTKVHVISPAFFGAVLPAILGFYAFYGILFEKYLANRKLLKFFLFVALLSLVAGAIAEVIVQSLFKVDRSFGTIFFSGLFLSFIALVNGIVGLIMKGFISWYRDIQIKLELTEKNHEMELALIKAQINPHFLFNTINNIDTLIKKDTSAASDYLNKLSDIMRFTLYESKNGKISLAKEVDYIEKYLELQKIRTSNENFVKYETQGDLDAEIEPMLLIPFIENAFKHSENKKVQEAIKIHIKSDKGRLHFECKNAYSNQKNTPQHSGLGNELIRRRLKLLYPNKHTFEISNAGGFYTVMLDINLSDNK
ncbi:MAG: histidine kinase [Bacteroidetes bacterium]|nr:histidine kinase [Bacteroidota bacterium]